MKRVAYTALAIVAALLLAGCIVGLMGLAVVYAFYALTFLSGVGLLGFLIIVGLAIIATALLQRVVLPFALKQWDQ